jgi:hypothetical protein
MEKTTIPKLAPDAASYVKWRRAVEGHIVSIPDYAKVEQVAFLGNLAVVQSMQPLANIAANKEENASRRKKRDKFEERSNAFFGFLRALMEETTKREIEKMPAWAAINSNKDLRGFWLLIPQMIAEKCEDEIYVTRAQDRLENNSQLQHETLQEYADRTTDMMEECLVLQVHIDLRRVKARFLKGLSEKYPKYVARTIEERPTYRDMTLDDLARAVDEVAMRCGIDQHLAKKRIDTTQDQKGSTPKREKVAGLKGKRKTKPGQESKSQQNGQGAETRTCFNCKEVGHISKDCPKPQRKRRVKFNNDKATSTSSYMIDSGASIGITDERDILTNLSSSLQEFVTANGDSLQYKLEGTHPTFGKMAVLENAPMKIASLGETQKIYETSFEDQGNKFVFRDRKNGNVVFEAPFRDGVYEIAPTMDEAEGLTKEVVAIIRQAVPKKDRIFQLHERLLHTNPTVMIESIRDGHYKDVIDEPINDEDWVKVKNCLQCQMAKDHVLPGRERGKEYKQKRPKREVADSEETGTVAEYDLSKKVEAQLYFDLVYVAGSISCCMLVRPHNYLLHTWVKNRSVEAVLEALEYLVSKVRASPGIARVASIHVDREKSVQALEREIVRGFGDFAEAIDPS